MQDLQPDNPGSEVDKVVKFILDQNIPIRYLEIKYNYLINRNSHSRFDELQKLAKANPKLKFVRFRPGKGGEGEIIQKNWHHLMCKAKVTNREKCYNDFFLGKFDLNSSRKRNVVGCYLGQGLPFIRISPTIVNYAIEVLGPWITGAFTKEEDEVILEEVAKNRAGPQTWKTLTVLLNRLRPEGIAYRFKILQNVDLHSGRWNLQEDSVLLEHLFRGKPQDSLELVQNISNEHLWPLVKIVDRSFSSIHLHWNRQLKPILLSYHNGELHFEWRILFYKMLIKQKIIKTQDINWSELSKEFPCQTIGSMSDGLNRVLTRYRGNKDKPIHEKLSEILPEWKHRRKSTMPKYREDIVHLYDKIRGVSD